MMELGMSNFMMFFLLMGAGMVFVITWIVRSETRINAAKSEIAKLSADIAVYEREKHALLEKILTLDKSISIPTASDEGASRDSALTEENDRLKKELEEAKRSLEEVYKALSSQE